MSLTSYLTAPKSFSFGINFIVQPLKFISDIQFFHLIHNIFCESNLEIIFLKIKVAYLLVKTQDPRVWGVACCQTLGWVWLAPDPTCLGRGIPFLKCFGSGFAARRNSICSNCQARPNTFW